MTDNQQRPTVPPELRQAYVENLTAVIVFLLNAKRQHGPNMSFGGRTVEEALTAFCTLAGIDKAQAEARL